MKLLKLVSGDILILDVEWDCSLTTPFTVMSKQCHNMFFREINVADSNDPRIPEEVKKQNIKKMEYGFHPMSNPPYCLDEVTINPATITLKANVDQTSELYQIFQQYKKETGQ